MSIDYSEKIPNNVDLAGNKTMATLTTTATTAHLATTSLLSQGAVPAATPRPRIPHAL